MPASAVTVTLLGLVLCVACAGAAGDRAARVPPGAAPTPAPAPAVDPYTASVDAWHAEREVALTSPTGYLALAGLTWIGPGSHSVGSAADADVRLPAGRAPERLGTLHVRPDGEPRASFSAAPGRLVRVDGADRTRAELRDDSHPDGRTLVSAGPVDFWLVRRGARLGVRVRDPASPVRAAYAGTPRFPVSRAWRVAARFEPFVAPRAVTIPSITGEGSEEWLDGAFVFELDGREQRLLPVPNRPDDGGWPVHGWWLIFGDASNGESTYAGGRFLAVDPPGADDVVILDFNRAYNPPCAYSPYTTCPLPPAENRLALPVLAGERAPDAGGGPAARGDRAASPTAPGAGADAPVR